jgi:hypothetical protein
MAVPLHSSTSTDRALRALQAEHKREADGRSAAWAFLWTLFLFKLATVGLIIHAASGTGESIVVTMVTTWYWFIIPAFALGGPLLVRWRMLRMRRNRERLRASEWDVEPEILVVPAPPSARQRGPADEGGQFRHRSGN